MNQQSSTLNAYITYILLTLVFLSSWTDINGIFAELPQIILTQPEGWKLGAYLALITNFGNIAPFVLVLIKCFSSKQTLNSIPINYIVMIIGMSSCFLLIFFWKNTTIIQNQSYSLALLILAFFLSLLDCTSSVSFADYIQKFRKEFTSSLFLGESLTSIIPSLLAIAQGNGQLHCISSNNGTNITEVVYEVARFSVSIYFLCLFLLLTISLISFILLQWTSIAQNSRQFPSKISLKSIENSPELMDTFFEQQKKSNSSELIHLTKTSYLLLSFGCTYTSSILFGMLLSISTYVLMPYGHRIFYLGTILSPWMLTLIWIFGMIKPVISKRYILILILCGSITFSFDLFVSFKSPCPPFGNTINGSIFILIIWLSTYVLLGYPRLVIANYVRNYSSNGMFWYGVNVQLGALIGSIIAYLLIETFSLFSEKQPCEQILC
jgi:riboflavin transporter 2